MAKTSLCPLRDSREMGKKGWGRGSFRRGYVIVQCLKGVLSHLSRRSLFELINEPSFFFFLWNASDVKKSTSERQQTFFWRSVGGDALLQRIVCIISCSGPSPSPPYLLLWLSSYSRLRPSWVLCYKPYWIFIFIPVYILFRWNSSGEKINLAVSARYSPI